MIKMICSFVKSVGQITHNYDAFNIADPSLVGCTQGGRLPSFAVTYISVFSLFFFHRKIHQVSSYFVTNEVAHTYLILRGNKCSSKTPKRDSDKKDFSDQSVIRVFLWPRNPVCGK